MEVKGAGKQVVEVEIELKIVDILKEEYRMRPEEINLKNLDSPLFIGTTKDLREKGKSE